MCSDLELLLDCLLFRFRFEVIMLCCQAVHSNVLCFRFVAVRLVSGYIVQFYR